MMRKNIVVAASLALLLLLAGCGSTKINLSSHSPIALVSVIGNSAIPWVKEDANSTKEPNSNGILTNMVNKMIDNDNPEMTTAVERLDYAVESFSAILPEVAGCEVFPNDELIKSEAYQDLRSSFYNALTSTKYATDHKDLTTFSGKKAAMFMSEINVKSLAILTFNFEKKLTEGNKWNGECSAVVTMKAKILDEKGKEIILKTYVSQSPKEIKIKSHKYDKQELADSAKEEIENVIRKFAAEFSDGTAEATSEASGESVEEPAENATATALPKPAKKAEAEVTETAAETEAAAQ